MLKHACNPSTWEAEAGRSRVQGWPGQHGEFEANQGYIVRPYLKKKKKEKQEGRREKPRCGQCLHRGSLPLASGGSYGPWLVEPLVFGLSFN
jgi:hypothetical protein